MFVSLRPQVSKISLVDLAGSERAKDTGAEGKRLQVGVAQWVGHGRSRIAGYQAGKVDHVLQGDQCTAKCPMVIP